MIVHGFFVACSLTYWCGEFGWFYQPNFMINFLNTGVRVGQIYFLDLGPEEANGYLTAGKRPCVVYKCIDKFRCVIMPLTSQKLGKVRYFEHVVQAGNNGLKRNSKVLINDFRNISVDRVMSEFHLGALSVDDMEMIRVIFRNLNL
jgi:mRNA-degrading endonuclease toxin of MazEF toxin-antitoxin module